MVSCLFALFFHFDLIPFFFWMGTVLVNSKTVNQYLTIAHIYAKMYNLKIYLYVFQTHVLLFFLFYIWENWDSEKLSKVQCHFAISGIKGIQILISELNPSSFYFTKTWRTQRLYRCRWMTLKSQNHFVLQNI